MLAKEAAEKGKVEKAENFEILQVQKAGGAKGNKTVAAKGGDEPMEAAEKGGKKKAKTKAPAKGKK